EETASHGHETVTLRLEPSGTATLSAGPPAAGQGLAPLLAQIVAREVGIAPSAVTVASGDTAAVDESFGTFGSRVATMLGNATALAARELAARLRAGARDGPIEVRAAFAPSGAAWSSGAHVAAVEVDPQAGTVRVVRYLIVHDSGAVLDEAAVRRQILGAAVQAIGGALAERLVYDGDGQPLVTTLADYAVPRATDVPPIEVVRLETPSPHNPLGLKGAGESGIMPAYAALAAAVEDAVDDPAVTVDALPVSSQDVWRWLARARGPA
ncbi:MAG: hypothetical protein QN159_00980, partial [Armatimonadota bacterium]|nr:hypothetical protein [Armatimonadota bacterium]